MNAASTAISKPARAVRRRRPCRLTGWCLLLLLLPGLGDPCRGGAAELPFGFEQTVFVDGLRDPNAMVFAPDGRLFVGERITGQIRVVRDGRLLERPFATLPVPPEAPGGRAEAAQPGFTYSHIYHYGTYRSSGLEGIAFDPEFARNGHVYVYFMNDHPRRNRVVRLTVSADDPDVADPASLRVLLDIPMHSHPTDGPVPDGGSHNGGALLFAPDGTLLVSVGDGWNPAPRDGPQDLGLLIGKVLRIRTDGTVPEDNPFVGVPGARPEIWALGFRNPYTMSIHPRSQRLYVNDPVGGKQTVHELVRGGNYQHPSAGPAGTPRAPLHTAQGLIAGGAWYSDGPFPEQYHGGYFITDWRAHAIRRMRSETNPEVTEFATGARHAVQTQVGPDGALYWLSTTYETLNGTVHRIHFRQETPVADPPRIIPAGGSFDAPVEVHLAASSPGAVVRYTLDGSEPTGASPQADAPLVLRHSARLKARTFATNAHPSATVGARFELDRSASTPSGLELAAHWPLDDGTGSLARDISGNGRHGRGRQVTWRTVPGDRALQFDGRDSRVDTGAWDLDAPAFTLSAWVRPAAFPAGNADFRVVAKALGEAEADHDWMLGTFRMGSELRLRFRLKTHGETATLIAPAGALRLEAWSHVAATYDGEAMRLYLNGGEVGSLAKTGEPDGNPAAPVWLGANPRTDPPRSFHGALRDIRIYRRALSADDLRNLPRETAPGIAPADALAQEEKERHFAPTLTLPGTIAVGRDIFFERCQTCHVPGVPGAPLLGPDLASYSERPAEWWLTAILDPNRDQPPEYWNYRAETADGETFEGLLVSETPGSVTLRPLLGSPQTIRRDALRHFERLPHSLMPEGLESGLSPAQLAGLLAYLRSGAYSTSR